MRVVLSLLLLLHSKPDHFFLRLFQMFYLQVFIGLILICVILRELLRLLRLSNYGDRYVVITGCDTGFGNLLAKRLDRLGVNVFAGCLTKDGAEELRKTASEKLVTFELNVTDEKSIMAAKEFVAKKLPKGRGA